MKDMKKENHGALVSEKLMQFVSKIEKLNEDKAQIQADIKEITEFYKAANIRCKEDESAKENARLLTTKIQDKIPEYYSRTTVILQPLDRNKLHICYLFFC